MLIVIDLGGDGEETVEKNVESLVKAEEVRQQRERWLEWVHRNEQVVPQVVPAY